MEKYTALFFHSSFSYMWYNTSATPGVCPTYQLDSFNHSLDRWLLDRYTRQPETWQGAIPPDCQSSASWTTVITDRHQNLSQEMELICSHTHTGTWWEGWTQRMHKYAQNSLKTHTKTQRPHEAFSQDVNMFQSDKDVHHLHWSKQGHSQHHSDL